MPELKVVHADGDSYTRGVTIGRALAEGHLHAVDFTRRYTRRHGLADADLGPVLAPYVAAAERTVPQMVAHLRGIAEGSGLDFIDVFAVNAFEELYAVLELSVPPPPGVVLASDGPDLVPAERCTDILVRTPAGTMLGHTEQWYAGDNGAIVVLVERPESDAEPSSVSVVAEGTLPLSGMNSAGVALTLMSLSGADEQVGTPRALMGHDAIGAVDGADVKQRATRPERAGGYTYACASQDGDGFMLEVTATRSGEATGAGHANHAVNEHVAEVAEPPSEGSASRHARVCELLESHPPQNAHDVMEMLSDHGAQGQNICVHPIPSEGEESPAIQFAVVCDVDAGTLWLAPGQPCDTAFQQIRLSDVL
jgi:isopenicillin-N N-acyltransferase-like protein